MTKHVDPVYADGDRPALKTESGKDGEQECARLSSKGRSLDVEGDDIDDADDLGFSAGYVPFGGDANKMRASLAVWTMMLCVR